MRPFSESRVLSKPEVQTTAISEKARGDLVRSPAYVGHLLTVFFFAALVYTALLILPAYYQTIIPGLDPSWGFGLNHFPHSEFKFGPDLIFTYGPLGFLAVPMNVASNIGIAMFVRLALWILMLWQLVALWRSGKRTAALFITASLMVSNKLYIYYWDYFVVALFLVLCFRLLEGSSISLGLCMVAVLMGISFLLKFTSFIMAAMMLSVCAVGLMLRQGRDLAVRDRALLALAFASGPIGYLLYDPSLWDLLLYARGALAISSGYAASMSLPTDPALAIRAGVVSAIPALCALFALWRRTVSLPSVALVFVATCMAFRHGFTRSGIPHSAVFLSFVVLSFGLLLAQIKMTRLATAVHWFLFCGVSFIALQGVSDRWPVWTRFWWLPEMNLSQAVKLLHWRDTMTELDVVSAANFHGTVIERYLDDIQGARVLVFPWDLAYAAHQNFTLVPLYAMQAYSAYTRYLDRTEAERLLSKKGPHFVVFEWQAIDGRHPLLDVPATWNGLFSKFVPYVPNTDSVLLAPRQHPLRISYVPLSRTTFQREDWVSIPSSHAPVGVSIDLKPTVAGSMVTALYKLPIILLQTRSRSGMVQTFRVPGDVLATPLPINCLPLSFNSLMDLWARNRASDPIVELRLYGNGLHYMQPTDWQFYDVQGTDILVGGT